MTTPFASWLNHLYYSTHYENLMTPVNVKLMRILSVKAMKACATKPCLNGGTCVVSTVNIEDYTCQCLPGLDGRNCEGMENTVEESARFDLSSNYSSP